MRISVPVRLLIDLRFVTAVLAPLFAQCGNLPMAQKLRGLKQSLNRELNCQPLTPDVPGPGMRMVLIPLEMMELTLKRLRSTAAALKSQDPHTVADLLRAPAQLERHADVLEVWVQPEREDPVMAQVSQ